MSFSTDLKLELYKKRPHAIHCRIAELAGILSSAGRQKTEGNRTVLRIRIDHGELEEKIRWLIFSLFDYEVSFMAESEDVSNTVITDETLIRDIYQKCKLKNEGGRLQTSELVIQSQCCKRSFLRGVYEAGGSITSPEKAYHAEITCTSSEKADQILGILQREGISGKQIERKSRFIVYLKDAEKISYLLGVMGAPSSMMEFENVRIVKDIRNSVNREVNCDAANIRKTTDAAVKVSEDIHYIFDTVGADYLSPSLKEIAMLRLEFPDLSLKELGEHLDPPLGKSGVNHRLRKLCDIAEKLKC